MVGAGGAELMRSALLASLLLAGCSVAQSGERSPHGELSDGSSFTCSPLKLWDADGPLHCAEGPRVRLAGIAARELDGSCRSNHPCPAADPVAARDHLASLLGEVVGQSEQGHLLIRGAPLSCVSNGSAGGGRVGAWCSSPTVGDLSCRMVADGMAARWDRYWRGHQC